MIRQIAVLIPAADEEERITRCLASVRVAARQLGAHASIPARVIVALDSCRDATAAACAAFGDVDTVTVTARCAGAARRTAAAAALRQWHGRAAELWLASTDADSRVPPDWLTVMAGEARRGADLVLGTVLPGPGLDSAARARWLARHHLRDGHPHVHGANLGIRASSYIALGGWQPLAAGEDADLASRAASAGWARVIRTAAIPVLSSARRHGRAPGGFASYLRELSGPAVRE